MVESNLSHRDQFPNYGRSRGRSSRPRSCGPHSPEAACAAAVCVDNTWEARRATVAQAQQSGGQTMEDFCTTSFLGGWAWLARNRRNTSLPGILWSRGLDVLIGAVGPRSTARVGPRQAPHARERPHRSAGPAAEPGRAFLPMTTAVKQAQNPKWACRRAPFVPFGTASLRPIPFSRPFARVHEASGRKGSARNFQDSANCPRAKNNKSRLPRYELVRG